jgi:hypothetical protein
MQIIILFSNISRKSCHRLEKPQVLHQLIVQPVMGTGSRPEIVLTRPSRGVILGTGQPAGPSTIMNPARGYRYADGPAVGSNQRELSIQRTQMTEVPAPQASSSMSTSQRISTGFTAVQTGVEIYNFIQKVQYAKQAKEIVRQRDIASNQTTEAVNATLDYVSRPLPRPTISSSTLASLRDPTSSSPALGMSSNMIDFLHSNYSTPHAHPGTLNASISNPPINRSAMNHSSSSTSTRSTHSGGSTSSSTTTTSAASNSGGGLVGAAGSGGDPPDRPQRRPSWPGAEPDEDPMIYRQQYRYGDSEYARLDECIDYLNNRPRVANNQRDISGIDNTGFRTQFLSSVERGMGLQEGTRQLNTGRGMAGRRFHDHSRSIRNPHYVGRSGLPPVFYELTSWIPRILHSVVATLID